MRSDNRSSYKLEASFADVFRQAALQSDDELQAALGVLETSLHAQSVAPIIESLLEQPGCLEFVLSAIPDHTFSFISQWILNQYAGDLDTYSADSLCPRLLARFSTSLFFLSKRDDNGYDDLDVFHKEVLQTLPVLAALALIRNSDAPAAAPDDDDPEGSMFVTKKTSQRARKHMRKISKATKMVDPAPFRNYGIAVPQDVGEARRAAAPILRAQKQVLQTLLDMFRLPALLPTLKSAYIPQLTTQGSSPDAPTEASTQSWAGASAVEAISGAYPNVQPMKAALYFETAEGFGDWQILISGRADGHLREAKNKEPKLFNIILKKIKELSKGQFSDDNQKRLTGPGTGVPIFEAKMTRDARLVYQVDCIPEFDSQVERQVIKVFGIYTHAQMDKRLWNSISYQLSKKGKEYEKRCKHRCEPFHKGDRDIPPASFPPAPPMEMLADDNNASETRDEGGELHDLLVLEKFVVFSQALLTSILADQDVAHVFQVSLHEQEIIKHTYSCYVLGRSGTGKTTTMLFKMLGMENSWQQNRDMNPNRPRQLFVTQSRVLADKVEEYFIKLFQSLTIASDTEGISELLARQKNREDAGMIDRDEAVDWRDDLPRSFSALKDSHFPLFITFDKLAGLLEAEMARTTGKKALPLSINGAAEEWSADAPAPLDGPMTGSSEYMLQKRASFVSYDVFKDKYWPHFPQPLTKGLDVSLVFSEFMGVIKGSEQTLSSPEPFLDYEAYSSLSLRAQSMFANKRRDIYGLFQAYLRIKRERGDYDAADRTHAILREVRKTGVKGKKLDFLYVDEVQDNLLIDAKLLRSICHNPDGLFWAGDTAQTISVGSSFRFDDLKAFLHRIEESSQSRDIQTRAAQQPKSFHLATNFRSHAGIVKCAHSVIELITKFWPYAIDILPEERGVVNGIKPVFFSGWDQDNVRYESFLFGAAGNQIEFGAQQCILVRNDVAREKLREQVGDVGLIMTLYESKGLEFNDVLLYNFFEDSSVDVAQWRVVLNALERSQRSKIPTPTFDENRHAGVCSELKFLYVALTRARKNLWLIDRSETGEPMRTFWTARDLIQNCTPGTDVPQLAVSSTPEEWAKMARTLFDNKRYFQAMHSYERAAMPREKAIARAYHLRAQARSTHGGSRPDIATRRADYTAVAEAFISSALDAVKERTEYYRIAAECYVVIDENRKAALAFAHAHKFTEAVQYYRKAGMFAEAVAIIKQHRSEVDPDVAKHLYDIARFWYLRRGEHKRAADLFETIEEKLEFVTEYDFDAARVEILVDEGRFADAADIHRQEGRTLDAIGLYLKDESSAQSTLKAKDCILEALWGSLSFASSPQASLTPSLKKTLDYVDALNTSVLSSADQMELQMFPALARSDVRKLRSLGETILSTNKVAALLCLDRAFEGPHGMLDQSDDISSTLQTFHSYARLLQEIIFHPTPWTSFSLTKLFHLKMTNEGRLILSPGSFLHSAYEKFRARAYVEGEVEVDQRGLLDLYRFSLAERLRERIDQENAQCLRVNKFDPCQYIALRGRCEQKDCPRQHVFDIAWYNHRIRFYLQQTLILQIHQSLPNVERDFLSRVWFERLYESLNPLHLAFGSAKCLNIGLIPEAARGLGAVKEWIRHALYSFDPYQPRERTAALTNLLRFVDVGTAFDAAAIGDYLARTQIVSSYRPPHLLRPPQAYLVEDLAAFFKKEKFFSINAGALFFKHVLENRLEIDVGALCHFMDLLCGSFIFARKLWRQGTLHGTTLPRSWILEHIEDIEKLKNKEIQTFTIMVDPISDLLEQLYSGQNSDHLLYHRRAVQEASPNIKNMLIARICRSICLLGFNMGSQYLQRQIVRAINSLYKPGRIFPPLYSQYVQAPNWSRMARVATASIPNLLLDEMIVLAGPQGPSLYAFPGVRLLKFQDAEDIRRQLSQVMGQTSALKASASTFVPRQADMRPRDAESDGDSSSDEDEFQEDNDAEKAADLEALMRSLNTSSGGVSATVTAERTAAVLVFQRAYRRLLRRRSRFIMPGLPTLRAKQISAFMDENKKIEWPKNSYYKFLFLGPLPHLLVCLHSTLFAAMTTKTAVKKQSNSTKHQDVDALFDRQTKLNAHIKKINYLRQALEATSDLHRRRDLKELKSHAEGVATLVNGFGLAKELTFDMEIAWKGIVKEAVKVKVEKPSLNVEDILEDL